MLLWTNCHLRKLDSVFALIRLTCASQRLEGTDKLMTPYLAGWLARKHLSKHKCTECEDLLLDPDNCMEGPDMRFMKLKQYEGLPDCKGLTTPSQNLITEVTTAEELLRERIFQFINGDKVVENLMEKIAPELNVD